MAVRVLAVVAGVSLAAAARGDDLPAPRLNRGDELHYAGEVVEAGEGVGQRFRKAHDLEVRVLVLDGRAGAADCAVLTRVHPRLDDTVTGPVGAATGGQLQRPPAAVRVDYVRVDYRGRVFRLAPGPGLPVLTGPDVPAVPYVSPRPEALPLTEAGLFVARPAAPAPAGEPWLTVEPGRPPVAWRVAGDAAWNGGRCVEVTRTQQTAFFDRPEYAVTGWKRTDRAAVSPADGLVGTLDRRTERRQGKDVVGWVGVKLERQPAARAGGTVGTDARREAELAVAAGAEFDALVAAGAGRAEFTVRLARLERAAAETPAGAFREGLDAARRRFALAAAGDPPPSAADATPPAPVAVGQSVPDFVAPRPGSASPVRLSALSGAPVVLVFHRPGATTTAETLAVADALHARYTGRAAVVALSVYAPPGDTRPGGAPVADGAAAQAVLGVESYPRFYVLDAAGVLRWQAAGVGPEVGFLVKEQLERVLTAKPGGK